MPLSYAGSRIYTVPDHQEGLDPRALKQILKRLGIALANGNTLNQRAVGAVRVVALGVYYPLRQKIVNIKLLFELAHRPVDSGKNFLNLGLIHSLRCLKLLSDHQILRKNPCNGFRI